MSELKAIWVTLSQMRQVSKGLALANISFVKVYKTDISTKQFNITVSFLIISVNLLDPMHVSGCSLKGTLRRAKMMLDLALNLRIWLHWQTAAEAFSCFSITTVNVCLQMTKCKELTKSENTIPLSLQPCLFHYSLFIYPLKPNGMAATGFENIVQERQQICLWN